jgi:hypothetical protein
VSIREVTRCKTIAEQGRLALIAHTSFLPSPKHFELDLNPHFVKSILMLYSFEEVQKLAFRVYDMDTDFKNNSTDNVDVGKQDFLGEATCCLADIVGGRGGQKTIQLTSDQKGSCGSITIIAEELAGQNDLVQLVLCASKLPRMDTFGKSDPFLKIYKEKANTRTACFKTEVVKQNLSPQVGRHTKNAFR